MDKIGQQLLILLFCEVLHQHHADWLTHKLSAGYLWLGQQPLYEFIADPLQALVSSLVSISHDVLDERHHFLHEEALLNVLNRVFDDSESHEDKLGFDQQRRKPYKMRQKLVLVDQATGFLVEHQGDVVEAKVGVSEDKIIVHQSVSKDIDELWEEESKRVMGTYLLHQKRHRPQHVYRMTLSDSLSLQFAAQQTRNIILADQCLLPRGMVMCDVEDNHDAVGNDTVASLLKQIHEVLCEFRRRRLWPRDDMEIADDG